MKIRPVTLSGTLSALFIACAMAAIFAQPAVAQTAENLNCTGCVKSKHLKNNGVRSKDIKNGQVKNADLANGAVSANKLGSDVTALGLSGVAVVPAPDFRETQSADPDPYLIQNNGYIRADSNNPKCVAAPVHLPDGVVLTEMELIHSDGSASDLEVRLRRKSLTVPNILAEEIASVTTSGNSGGIGDVQSVSTTTFTETAVDAVNAFYYVETCLETSGLRLIAVRVFYI